MIGKLISELVAYGIQNGLVSPAILPPAIVTSFVWINPLGFLLLESSAILLHQNAILF